MMSGLLPFLIFLGVALVAGLVVFAIISDKRRAADIETLAGDLGFTYVKSGEVYLEEPFAKLHLFDQGYSKTIRNVLTGNIEDVSVLLFDYSYTTGSGRNSTTHTQTVAVYRVAEGELPSFELRPEHIFHKIGQAFGYQDIDLPDYPEFSKRYLLRGDDELAVCNAFQQETIERLEREKGWHIEAMGQWMVIYDGKRLKPGDWTDFLDRTWGLFLSFEVG